MAQLFAVLLVVLGAVVLVLFFVALVLAATGWGAVAGGADWRARRRKADRRGATSGALLWTGPDPGWVRGAAVLLAFGRPREAGARS